MITRRRALGAACIVVCVSAVFVLLFAVAAAHRDGKQVAAPTSAVLSVRCPGPAYQSSGHPIGVPAILPRNDCTPSFTRQDVVAYLRTHPFPNKGIAPDGLLTVTEVAFMPVQALPALDHDGTFGLPGSAMVCYVALHGTVTYTSLAAAPTMHTATVYVVFDAHSGNLLASGG